MVHLQQKMAVEIERKFLVVGEFRHLAVAHKEIVQAYLSTDQLRMVRLRIVDNEAYITIKGLIEGKFASRNEWEIPVSYKNALEIMEVCLPGRIIKTRYIVPSGDHIFEVDVFHEKNEGLIIAEIELSEENEYFIKPEWLGEEVTGNPAYFNYSLIK